MGHSEYMLLTDIQTPKNPFNFFPITDNKQIPQSFRIKSSIPANKAMMNLNRILALVTKPFWVIAVGVLFCAFYSIFIQKQCSSTLEPALHESVSTEGAHIQRRNAQVGVNPGQQNPQVDPPIPIIELSTS